MASRSGVNETFTDIRAGAGTTSDDTATSHQVRLTASSTSNQFALLSRMIMLFDTSSIAAGATVTSATLSMFLQGRGNGLGGSVDIDIVTSTPASNTAVANGDYANLGTTPLASNGLYSMTLSAMNDWTLSTTDVVKAGITKLGATLSWDTDNSFGGTWSSSAATFAAIRAADYAGTDNDPVLVVVYTPPAAGIGTQVNVGDTWKDATGIEINIADSWRTVTKVQLNVSDVWKTVFG